MQLLKTFLFVSLIYLASASVQEQPSRDWFYFVDPLIRRFIEYHRDILNNHCKNFIEEQSKNFKTGWPTLNIPPFDPIPIDSLTMPIGIGNFTIFDAELSGIADIFVNKCDLKIFGFHDTAVKIGAINYHGEGDALISLTNVNVKVSALLGVIGENQLNLDDFTFDIDAGDVTTHLTGFGFDFVNKLVSTAIGEALHLAVNAGDVLFEILFAAFLYPLNAILNQVKLPQLIADVVEFIQRYNN